MSNCGWLNRITNTGASAVVYACVVLLAGIVLLPLCIVQAYPVCAKDQSKKEKPKYVGDFPEPTKRQNIQIIDDGPNTVQYRHAPIVVIPAGPEARPPIPKKRGPAIAPQGPIGDFPLPEPSFPQKKFYGEAFARPLTASPNALAPQAKPTGAGGAVRKGDSPRLRKPTNMRVNASPIQTYSSGYVPGSSLTEVKPNGCSLRGR